MEDKLAVLDKHVSDIEAIDNNTMRRIKEELRESGNIVEAFVKAGYPRETVNRLIRAGSLDIMLKMREDEILGGELNNVRLLTEYVKTIGKPSDNAAMEKIRMTALKEVTELTGLRKNELVVRRGLDEASTEELIKLGRDISIEIGNVTKEGGGDQEGTPSTPEGERIRVLPPVHREDHGTETPGRGTQFESARHDVQGVEQIG